MGTFLKNGLNFRSVLPKIERGTVHTVRSQLFLLYQPAPSRPVATDGFRSPDPDGLSQLQTASVAISGARDRIQSTPELVPARWNLQ